MRSRYTVTLSLVTVAIMATAVSASNNKLSEKKAIDQTAAPAESHDEEVVISQPQAGAIEGKNGKQDQRAALAAQPAVAAADWQPYGNRYAIIVTGEGTLSDQHWSGCTTMYRNLLEIGFIRENIRFLGPSRYARSHPDIVSGEASPTRIEQAFQWARSTCTQADLLYIYWIGHGGSSQFATAGNPVRHSTLASWIKGIKAKQIIGVYQPCFSGAVVDDISGENIITLTSTDPKTANSGPWAGNIRFALLGPRYCDRWKNQNQNWNLVPTRYYVDQDGDGQVSVTEAYIWVAKHEYVEGSMLDDNGDGVGGQWMTETFDPYDPDKDGYIGNHYSLIGWKPSHITLREYGQEPRKIYASARKIVDELYEKDGLYSNVIDKLKADKTLDESVSEVALKIAHSRRWQDVAWLTTEGWEIVRSADKNVDTYESVLEKAREVAASESCTPFTLTTILTTLGVAQYRVGAYADALDTLKQAKKMRMDINLESDPDSAAFTAMTQYQLGQIDEGISAINTFRDMLEKKRFADFTSGKLSCWIEAEKVFAGANEQLVAVWDLISTKDFDQAVETFTELLPATKETDSKFTFSSEGIAQYLGRFFYVRGKSRLEGKEPDYVNGASDYEAAIRINPNYVPALKNLAWLRATCAIEQAKDVKKAVELARLTCERTNWKNHECLSVLAAAYSESGRFTDAVRSQQEAISLLPAEDQAKWADNYSERLRLYQSNMSYRPSERWNFTGDISTLPEPFVIQPPPKKNVAISFSPDGTRFATIGNVQFVLILWDAMLGVELRRLKREPVPNAYDLAFSPDGKRIAVAEGRDGASVWDVQTGEQLTVFRGHNNPVVSVAYSPDGRRIASYSRETIRVWDGATGTELMRLEDKEAADIRSLTYNPDGSRLISYGRDNIIRVWDVASGSEILSIENERRAVGRIAISRDGKQIALGGTDRTILIWDATNGRQLMTLRGHKGTIGAVSFSPVADRLASCGYDDGTVHVWDTTSGLELLTLFCDQPRYVTFNPDGSTIAAVCREGIILWETKEPVGGLGKRRNAQSVRQLVQRLYQKYGTYQDVMDQLSGDDTIDESVREMALQIVDSRMPQEAYDVAWNVLNTLLPFEKDTQEYQEVLVKLEKAIRLVPDHYIVLRALGAIQCHLGAYEDALKTLAKSEQIYSDMAHGLDLVGLTFRVIALHGIGQIEDAKAALVQLQGQLNRGESTLHYAARNGYRHLVEFILDEGADMSSINTEGFTPIEVAMKSGYRSIVELLAAKGAEVSIHIAAYLGDVDQVSGFIESGVYVDTRDKIGLTPLAYATNMELAELLLTKGAQVDAKSKTGWTPLHSVAEAGHVDIAELLIDKGAQVDVKSRSGWTPLHSAAEAGHIDIAELLIDKGADVNSRYNWGQTPLIWAAQGGHKAVAELLIARGADINTKDNQGRTALRHAQDKGHYEIVELLKKHGAKE